eukprot:1757189-Pyramimonas_sp.AAC.1
MRPPGRRSWMTFRGAPTKSSPASPSTPPGASRPDWVCPTGAAPSRQHGTRLLARTWAAGPSSSPALPFASGSPPSKAFGPGARALPGT